MLMCIAIKKLNSLVTELFTRERKLNISLVFITQSYFEFRTKESFNKSYLFIHQILTLKTL